MTIVVNGLELAPNRRKVKVEEILNPNFSIPSLQGPAIEVPKDSLSVCVLQSESCTVPWSHGGVVGSQDATTCVIVFVLCGYGVTVLHFDEDTSTNEEYLKRSLVGIEPSEEGLQLHLVGGYDDEKDIGRQVVENLLSFFHFSAFRFFLGTATVGSVNTRVVDRGTLTHKAPIFHGACVDLSDRQLRPATFADRGPMLAVRQCRCMTGGAVTDVYDAQAACFIVRPWRFRLRPGTHRAFTALSHEADDERLLQQTSTSPLVEGPSFAAEMRACLTTLAAHPDSEGLFAGGMRPLRFRWDPAADPPAWRPASPGPE